MKITRNILAFCTVAVVSLALGYGITTYLQNQNAITQTNCRKFQAIIFDMDGTIIDTDHLWKSANGPILDSHAPHLSQAEKQDIIDTFHKLTIYEVWKLIKEHCSIDISSDQIIEENIQHLHRLYKSQGISFIPNFHAFHEEVIARGLKTAVATSSIQETVDTILTVVPLQDYFAEHIYNADHVNRTYKPAPDVYLHAAKMIGVQPCNCIAIEDSSGGIKAAKAAGMYCIGINTAKNRKALSQADEIIDCFSEINLDKLLSIEN